MDLFGRLSFFSAAGAAAFPSFFFFSVTTEVLFERLSLSMTKGAAIAIALGGCEAGKFGSSQSSGILRAELIAGFAAGKRTGVEDVRDSKCLTDRLYGPKLC